VVAGAPVGAELIERQPETPRFERGERAVDVVASGSAQAGARVDVLVTTEQRTRLALEDVEVLAARATSSEKGPRVVATLRVRVTDAVYLVAAQSFAQDVRLLVRAPGDEGEVGELVVGKGL
jgi:pilus assembly protein CpaB